MSKKNYPLQIHKDLNSLKEQFKVYYVSSGEAPLLIFEDKDEESTFFFKINKFKSHYNEFLYSVSYKPLHANNLAENSEDLKFPDVEKRLQSWVNTIKKFDETPHFSNDPILDKYAEEYFEEFKLLDEDADTNPFDINRQIIIDKYLERTIIFLNEWSEKNPDSDLEEPKSLAVSLKNQITQLTKNEVIKRLSLLWATARKKGLPILKEIFFDFAKDVIISLGKEYLGIK